MRTHWILIAAACLTLLAGSPPTLAQPRAGDCMIGPGLGATLLFPYFETDLNSFDGPATLVSINNGLADPVLVRVVLWTDWGNPTLAFDIYIPGFGLSSLNLRDTFNGNVPSTGDGVDLSAYPFCDTLPPTVVNPALSADERAQLRADHTGQPGPLASDCAGSFYGDGIARGYITVDVVDECSGLEAFGPIFTPANTTYPYFANGQSAGIGINDNTLWGDIFYLSNDASSAQGSGAIPLWADDTLFSGLDLFTFYGRFSGYDGRDNRVPLPDLWDQRFINGGPFAGGADLIVFHQPTGQVGFASCGFTPAALPLDGSLATVRGTGTDLVDLASEFADAGGLVTQRVAISDLSIPYAFGWIQFGSALSQAWVQPALSAAGIYSASLHGTPVEFRCDDTPSALGLAQAPATPATRQRVDGIPESKAVRIKMGAEGAPGGADH